ncbi:MAG: DUF2065 family protein [Betaproteobacteria bacterium]|nr:DUF2065 family protein [Betaproteobacteria bacterium]
MGIKKEPGLYFKVPILDNVRYFDVRILTIDTAEPERFLTSEKKNVLVDLFVKWRIADVRQYYVSVGGDEVRAQTRLLQTVNDGLRAEFGNRTVHDVVSGERDKIMELMRQKANEDAGKIGVEVFDVRMKRVDLPQEVSESVYRRMDAERKRVANELRSTGAAEAERIRADADRQREIIVAQAYRDAQRIKGEGDGPALPCYRRCRCIEALCAPSAPRVKRNGRQISPAMGNVLLTAFALMLVIEGILPFLVPGIWRETFRRLTEMTDGQIRFIGLTSMLAGLLLLYFVRRL